MDSLKLVGKRPGLLESGLLFLITMFLVYGFAATSAFGLPFYQGKTLKIIVTSSPGGGSDTVTRLLAKHMSKFIPGKPTIIVQNMPGGGNIIGMNYLYAIAKPDGLTFGHTSIAGVREQLFRSPGVKYDYRKFDYIGNSGTSWVLFAIRSNLPYKNLEDLRKAKETLFVASGSKASNVAVISGILAQEGFKLKAVTGYRGTAPRLAAVLKGEADLAMVTLFQAVREKKGIRPLFWIASKGSEFTDLPNMEEMQLSSKTRSFLKAVTIPLTLARSFLAPPNTHKERLKILQKAFERTVKSPEYLGAARKLNLPVRWRSPEETKTLYLKVLDTPAEGAAALKKIMGISG